MKWRNLAGLFLACLIMLSLCGCASGEKQPQETENALPSVTGMPKVENPGNALVDYDPARELYILCENVHLDIYASSGFGMLYFYIFSRAPLEADSISVEIPIETNYDVSVFEYPAAELRQTEATALKDGQSLGQVSGSGLFPYYLYQCYAGVDFSKIGSLRKGAQEAEGNHMPGAAGLSDQWYAMVNEEIPNFMKLKAEELPEFYVYSVDIVFPGDPEKTQEESFHSMDVTIGDKTYHKEIGEVNFISGDLPLRAPVSGLQYTPEFLQQSYTSMMGTTQHPYSDGIGQDTILSFTAQENMTLTGFQMVDRFTEILDLQLIIESASGASKDIFWDGASPIDAAAGDKITLILYYKNPNMAGLWYETEMYAELDYTTGGAEQCILASRHLVPAYTLNKHELYAIIFDGLDMEPYYRDYYYPLYEPMLEDYRK